MNKLVDASTRLAPVCSPIRDDCIFTVPAKSFNVSRTLGFAADGTVKFSPITPAMLLISLLAVIILYELVLCLTKVFAS